MLGDQFSVDKAPELSIRIPADPAFSNLIRSNAAMLRAKKAMQQIFIQPPVEHSLFHARPFRRKKEFPDTLNTWRKFFHSQ
jgi:hypothetical protein